MFDFLDIKTIFVIFHLFGVILGAGAAFMTDSMFMYSTKDKKLSRQEVNFISLGSKMVWIGIFVIIISGTALFFLDPERLIASTKFQAKLTIVSILLINGIIFHKYHLPFLRRLLSVDLLNSKEFLGRSNFLFISGAISVVSWLVVLALGAISSIPYPYWMIMMVYFIVLAVAITFSFVVKKVFFKK